MARHDAEIGELLFTAISAAVLVCTDTVATPMTISFPLRSFTPPISGKYLEAVWIPNDPDQQAFWGDEVSYQGLFNIVLHWSQDNQGMLQPARYLTELLNYFYKGLVLWGDNISICIYDHPSFGSPTPNGHESLFVLSIRYRDHKPGAR